MPWLVPSSRLDYCDGLLYSTEGFFYQGLEVDSLGRSALVNRLVYTHQASQGYDEVLRENGTLQM